MGADFSAAMATDDEEPIILKAQHILPCVDQQNALFSLPQDLIFHILSFCTFADLTLLESSCKQFQKIIHAPEFVNSKKLSIFLRQVTRIPDRALPMIKKAVIHEDFSHSMISILHKLPNLHEAIIRCKNDDYEHHGL